MNRCVAHFSPGSLLHCSDCILSSSFPETFSPHRHSPDEVLVEVSILENIEIQLQSQCCCHNFLFMFLKTQQPWSQPFINLKRQAVTKVADGPKRNISSKDKEIEISLMSETGTVKALATTGRRLSLNVPGPGGEGEGVGGRVMCGAGRLVFICLGLQIFNEHLFSKC